jgi:hypothetical protein
MLDLAAQVYEISASTTVTAYNLRSGDATRSGRLGVAQLRPTDQASGLSLIALRDVSLVPPLRLAKILQ